jgi:GNAT superfamily N-acetyltransferase
MRKGWKRVHRLVVLPDYQGIGIGVKFINEISKHYIDNGFNINLTTTTPALVQSLCSDNYWALVRSGRVTNVWGNKGNFNKETSQVKGASVNRVTYSFNFKK